MSKRILAVVLALVMAMSLLTVNVFADDSWNGQANLSYIQEAKQMKVTWAEATGATSYTVTLYNGTKQVNSVTLDSSKAKEYTFSNVTAGGIYQAEIEAKYANKLSDRTKSNTQSVPYSFTSGKIKVESPDGIKTTVSWDAVEGAKGYVYSYTYYDEAKKKTETCDYKQIASTTVTIDAVTFANLRTISVYYQNSGYDRVLIGTVNVQTGTGSTTGTGSQYTTTGSVSYSNGYLSWTGATANYVTIVVYAGNQYYTSLSNIQGTSTYFANALSSVVSANPYSVITVYVYNGNYTGSNANLLGTLTYNGYSYGGFGYGLNVTCTPYVQGGYIAVAWSPVSGAASYVVNYSVNGAATQSQYASGTSCNIPWSYGQQVTISVWAQGSNGLTIAQSGNAVVSATGTVSYSGGGYPGVTGGNAVSGNNCVLYVGSSSTSVQLYSGYTVGTTYALVTVNGSSQQPIVVYSNPFTINVGANSSFSVIVYNGSSVIAQASYTATSSSASSLLNSNSKTSYTRGITLKAKNSSTTTVSWDAVPNAAYYEYNYLRTGIGSVITATTTKTSFDVPFGKAVGFEVIVYAYVNNRPKEVGEALHIAGDNVEAANAVNSSSSSSSSSKVSAYVTGLKGTVGKSGSITLSWNAASGNPNYEVWYKKSTASTWKKVYTTSGRALKVNKLSNGTSYDFKVVANGRDSGILTMTIGTTSSTKTAPDPEGVGTTTSAVPVITSISGGNGSITVSWSPATGATKYQVWVNQAGTTTYTKKATVDGTSASITGLKAGSYKVRIKASKDGTTWYNFNDSNCIKSDYRTVDVK